MRFALLGAGLLAAAAAVLYPFRGMVTRATVPDAATLAERYSASPAPSTPPVEPRVVRAAIDRAARYLREANRSDGEFAYLVNVDPHVQVPRDYNVLRHAGAIYSLGMAERIAPDPANAAVMQRALQYMRRCCFERSPAPGLIGIRNPDFALERKRVWKLGSAGIGLLAMASVAAVAPAAVDRSEMHEVAAVGHLLQDDDGRFYGLYDPKLQQRSVPGAGRYYPGEMMIGWLRYFEQAGDEDAWQGALRGLTRYGEIRRSSSPQELGDHWLLLATAELFAVAERHQRDIPRQPLIDRTVMACHAILESAPDGTPPRALVGALAANGNTTSTATKLEGLQAALTVLPPGHPIVPHVRAAVDGGIDFLVRTQIKEWPFVGGMPGAAARYRDPMNEQERTFNRTAGAIRVDYVQHALSAFVQYVERDRPAG